ncbi:hypothetical protein MMC28_006133 [Mycoblastus sanguinarius]|nr:hypothetical protein [Mycoblastus sanguinarius]
MAGAGQKRNISEYQSDSYPPMSYNPAMNTPGMSSEPHPHYIPGAGIPSAEHPRVTGPIVLGDADVVGRGLLHADTANELFNHYTNHMTRQMPIVVLPNDSSSEYMRNAKPVLFLAILSVASVHDLQAKLTKEITRLLADHVTVNGEKSLELLQALLVITTWYWPATNGNSNYFHFVHMAAVMAKDLGIDRSSAFKKDQNFDFLNTNHSLSDKGTVECRRAWLGCYVLCSR